MRPKSLDNISLSEITSILEGRDLSEMRKVWREAATSEARIDLLAKLMEKNLGFNEIEKFSLGLIYSLKSDRMREKGEKPVKGIIEAALQLKFRDEVEHCKEFKKKRERMNGRRFLV